MVLTHSLARNPKTNAALGWASVGVVILIAGVSLQEAALLGGLLALVAAGLLVVPAVLRRDWRVMLPWPLGFAVAVGVTARTVGVAPEATGYVAISAVALAAVVELDSFTDVVMSRRFAVLFAVMTTIALQSWWTITGYYSDQWFGTAFIVSQADLQWDFVAVMIVSLGMGLVFMWYFDHVEHVGSRHRPIIPEETP